MAYWIYENGETIGPLRREQVLQQAGPGTPVSDGGEWINLGQHPDFARAPERPSVPDPIPQPDPEQATAPVVQTDAPEEVAELEADREDIPDPEDSDFRRVRRLAKASKPSVPETSKNENISRGRWVIVVAGIAIIGFVAYALFQLWEAEPPRNDSKIFDNTDSVPGYRVDQDRQALSTFEEAPTQPGDRSPQTANGPQTIDDKIAAVNSQLREIANALKPIEAEFEKLSFRHPTFNVSGEISDRNESSVQVWGVALPSTGDITHLGAVVQKGNIVVINVSRVNSPSFYAQEGLYLIEKTTAENRFGGAVPIRVYSTQPPPARLAVEQEFDRLRNEMRPYQAEIERLKGELYALHREKYQQEWEAVADSVPQLVAYAKEHFAADDREGSARACARIEELAPSEADPYVECGLLAEQSGEDMVAVARYREAIDRDAYHAMANRREALLLSRQQEDAFEEARYLLRYEEFDDPTAVDAQTVHDRLAELKEEWGRQARRACLAFDTARIDQVQWDAMNKGPTFRESVARNISSCEQAKAEARAQLHTLNSRLVSINLDVQALMMDSRDDSEYWRSRSRQASVLGQQIGSAENSLKYEYQEEKIPIHRERIRQYQEILSEIEQEARKVGVPLS